MAVSRIRTRTCGAVLVGAALLLPLAAPALAAPGVSPVRTGIVPDAPSVTADDAAIGLQPIGTFESGVFDESASEIVVFHAATQRTFVVNAQAGDVQVLDTSDPTAPTAVQLVSAVGAELPDGTTVPEGAEVNSVAVREDGLGVMAVAHPDKVSDGFVVFFDAESLAVLGAVQVGALPDSIAISPDGVYAATADEGEPADDFSVDPEGSISVVTLPDAVAAATQDDVRAVTFEAFDEGDAELPEGVRIVGPQVPNTNDRPERRIAQNLEPEYVTISGSTAYVSIQEANAIAQVDLETATLTALNPLGYADHSQPGHGIDPSDRDPRDAPTFDVRTIDGLYGIYMPDGLDVYTAADGSDYVVSANEGDAREWGDYLDSVRVKDLEDEGHGPVCADAFSEEMLSDANLGRLNVSIEDGFDEEAGCYTELYAGGSRSFSIWDAEGNQVFDSGEDFERITHEAAPDFFNSNHSESNLEGRSDDKGPEPEGVAVGQVGENTYAFIALERVSGIMVYDITDPADSTFVTYVNNRDFSISMEDADDPDAVLSQAGDLGPESIEFVPADVSPTGSAMIIVGNEVSGTTTFFSVDEIDDEPAPEPTPPGVGNGFYLTNGWDGTADATFSFGRASDEVLIGDWDGDGVDSPAVRRGNAYFLSNSFAGGRADVELRFGRASDQVLVGDWDADGVDSLAVRRGNAYFLSNTLAGGAADVELAYGRAVDRVLVGDWDGDGTDTLGVRRGNAYFLANSFAGGHADLELTYGRSGDVVLVGDWDGDGSDTLGVRR
ncbi:MAG: choice-of-anchor I family protein [Actinomycetaceae bacterium]